MKFLICFFTLLSAQLIWAKDYKLTDASAEYTVKHIFKTVKGQSHDLKGKMVCDKALCEYLVAIPVKSFVSSDSNRDLNMQTILEASKYPLVTVKGSVAEAELVKDSYELKGLVSFHGVEKEYKMKITKGKTSAGSLVVLLEEHKVERPSLFTAKIDNEVPVSFAFNWKE